MPLIGCLTLTASLPTGGYDSDDFLQTIAASGADAVVPARKSRLQPRAYDYHLYKERHLVECFINKLKWFRRIFTRYDKLARRYMAFWQRLYLDLASLKCQQNLVKGFPIQ
ncbi:MAG: hypothetical protein R2867_27860 [Caldilineaceae bacterium]